MTPEQLIDIAGMMHYETAQKIIALHDKELAAQREAVLEEACRAVCFRCEEGKPFVLVEDDPSDSWYGHPTEDHAPYGKFYMCEANPIRRLAAKEKEQGNG